MYLVSALKLPNLMNRLPLLLFFTSSLLWGQEIHGVVLDSLNNDPIPFATVLTNFNQNSITNEEGKFRLQENEKQHLNDSIFVSCMGYHPFKEAIHQLSDTPIFLVEKNIELDGVILSQKELSAEEIVKKASDNLDEKYETALTEKTFFMRESFEQNWDKMFMKVKKTSITEFRQQFWDSLFRTLPKKDSWHTESYGKFYGNRIEKNQKLALERAVELADTINEKGYEYIEKKITDVLDEQVKVDSYFKFKSGIFSTKIDRDEVIGKEKDSLQSANDKDSEDDQKKEKKKTPEERFHSDRKARVIGNLKGFIKKDELRFHVFTHRQHYDYSLVNFTYLNDTPVYQIEFKPSRSKGRYKGVLYIDADNFSLLQMDYENTKNIKDFSLLGLSFQLYKQLLRIKFSKFDGQKYQLQFMERIIRYRTGIRRPIKIVEKNKHVRGRRKQNELIADIDMQLNNEERYTLVVLKSKPLAKEAFVKHKEIKQFKPDKRNNYDPSYWEGFTIIEPNSLIRSFKTK